MADATISIQADGTQAAATFQQLKQITDELFNGIPIEAGKANAAQQELIRTWQGMGVSVLQANDAAARLRPELEGISTGSQTAGFNLRELSKSFLGTVSAVALLRSNLQDLKPSLELAGTQFRGVAKEMGLSNDSAEVLTNTFEMMTNPFTIVENLTENLKISARLLAEALYDEASAADAATEAQQRKAGVLAAALSEQQKLVEQEQRGTESLERRTEAIYRQIQLEQESGSVKQFYLDKLKAILDEYEKRGEIPPEKVSKLAASLGVLSGEQEKAAAAADKVTESVERESVAQTKVVEQQDKLIPQLQAIAEGKREQAAATDEAIRALREETAALEANAKAAEQAAEQTQKKSEDAAKRIAELEDKPVKTIDEQNELNDLKDQQVQIDQDAADAAENAAQASFEYGQAQDELAQSTKDATGALDDHARTGDYAASVMAELEAATAGYQAAIAGVGDEAQSTTAYVEAIGTKGEPLWTNFTDTVVEGNEALGDTGDSLADISSALPRTADGLYEVGEALRDVNSPQDAGGEKAGLDKAIDDVKWFNGEGGRTMIDLLTEIKSLAGSITLGGGNGPGI